MTKATTNPKGTNTKKTPMERLTEKVQKINVEQQALRTNLTFNIKQGMQDQYEAFRDDVAHLRKIVRLDIYKRSVLTGVEWITRGRPEHAGVSVTVIKTMDMPDDWWEKQQQRNHTLAGWVLLLSELAKQFDKEEKVRAKTLKTDLRMEVRKKTQTKK